MRCVILLYVFLILLGLLYRGGQGAMTMGYDQCPKEREAYVPCLKEALDVNATDDQVTVTEFLAQLDHFIEDSPVSALITSYRGYLGNTTLVFERCDADEDGVLTESDWLVSNTTCLGNPVDMYLLCLFCRDRNMTMLS